MATGVKWYCLCGCVCEIFSCSCQLLCVQLVCFGIMGSFELATDMCQQQQQQQQGDAAASSNSYQLASFWPAWHSYMPLGLLAVATAAGQLPEQRALLAHQLQQVQGPWINIMQNKALLDNLCDIAGAYDEVGHHPEIGYFDLLFSQSFCVRPAVRSSIWQCHTCQAQHPADGRP